MSSHRSPHKRALQLKRRRPFKTEKESFLIICEGENTEPEYFNSFRLSSADIRTICCPRKGNSLNFVRSAIRVKQDNEGDYDNYWVVFDKDQNSNYTFNASIALADENGFQIAYSNQAFEFWYILHFNYHTGTMPRSTYKARLDRYLRFDYNKEKSTCRRMYDVLLPRQQRAISNAERVFSTIGDHTNPASEESSTTVHELVKSLNKFI